MAGKVHDGMRAGQKTDVKSGERGQRRPYQKPGIERHVASSLILGSVSGDPDGISGGERRLKP